MEDTWEEEENGDWKRQVALLPPALIPPLPHWTLGSFPSACCSSRNLSAEGMVGVALALGFITVGERKGFQGPGSSSTLCMTQVQNCRRTTGTMIVASSTQS